MTDIRLPQITGGSAEVQLRQVKSYLYQLVQQLNFALTDVEKQATTAVQTVTAAVTGNTEKDAQSTFNSIKALIIKSADIVNAYYDAINTRLEGEYVAISDFGTFSEQTSQDITANATEIQSIYKNIQTILTDIESVESTLIEVNAHINSGLIGYADDGTPVYGLEIGQRNEVDGVETFNKYAQFTADRLSFFDQNSNEVAYISDRKLYITDVEITGSMLMGGFKDIVVPGVGVVTKWIGG